MKFFFDTSVLIAVAVAHHPHHSAGLTAYRQVMSGRNSGAVSAHGLAETFSTLTRLPLSPAIHPSEAYLFINETVLPHCEIVSLDAKDYLAVLGSAAKSALRGGVLYDALQLRCAEKARSDRIYTFNHTHFVRLAPALHDKIRQP